MAGGKTRPTLRPPSRGIFDEMVDEAKGDAPTSPAQLRAVDPVDEQEQQTPAAEAAAEPVQEAEPVREPAPAPRQAPRRQGAPRAARQAPAARTPSVALPPAPAGFLTSKKPLQVKMDPQQHWNLKIGMTMRGRDMSSVVSALISAFNHDPDLWLTLMDRAVDERVDLGELLAPALEQLRDS